MGMGAGVGACVNSTRLLVMVRAAESRGTSARTGHCTRQGFTGEA